MRFYHRSLGKPRKLGVLAGQLQPADGRTCGTGVRRRVARGPASLRRAERFPAQAVLRRDARPAPGTAGRGRAGGRVRDRVQRAGTVRRHRPRVPRTLWRRDSAVLRVRPRRGRAHLDLGLRPRRAWWRRCCAISNCWWLRAAAIFEPPAEFRHRIHPLAIRGDQDDVSSTEVRERIQRGERLGTSGAEDDRRASARDLS